MKFASIVAVAVAFLQCSLAFAQRPAPVKAIAFNQKFQAGPAQAGPQPLPLVGTSGYANVKYSIGTTEQKEQIEDIIREMASTLPEQFGNSKGTYTVTLTVTDLAGKTIAQEPILSFQWERERGFFFIDKVVNDVRRTSWRGTLLNQVTVADASAKVRVAVEVYSQKDRSLDFDLLKKTATSFSAGAFAALLPLPAAAIPIIDSIKDLANSIYANSRKDNLVDTEEIALDGSARPLTANISVGAYNIPVTISVEVTESRFVNARLSSGKFSAAPDESIFRNASMVLAPGKSVSIVELIATSSDGALKSTRTLLDAVMGGGTYGKDPANQRESNIAALCGNLYDALNLYMSKYDARAMFWAFHKKYGESMNKAACLGSRANSLTEVGLSQP